MRSIKQKQFGFTIVELLIVVVVIAILAAITIVAYNGIQQRAKDVAAQSTASQAMTKVTTYGITNGDIFPSDLSALAVILGVPAPSGEANSLTGGDGTTYQYTVNNTSTPHSYCLTTTKNNISYFYNAATGSSVSKGACAGHGANGAMQIANLLPNPRPSTSYWFPSSAGVASVTYVNSGVNSAARSTRTTTANYGLYSSRSPSVAVAHAGDVYTILFTVVSSVNTDLTYQIGYGSGTATLTALNLAVPLTAGTPQTIRHIVTIPSGYDGQPIFNKFLWASGPVNEWFEVSKVMWVRGEYTGAYADGGSPGWAWSGTANDSTSTGPPL